MHATEVLTDICRRRFVLVYSLWLLAQSFSFFLLWFNDYLQFPFLMSFLPSGLFFCLQSILENLHTNRTVCLCNTQHASNYFPFNEHKIIVSHKMPAKKSDWIQTAPMKRSEQRKKLKKISEWKCVRKTPPQNHNTKKKKTEQKSWNGSLLSLFYDNTRWSVCAPNFANHVYLFLFRSALLFLFHKKLSFFIQRPTYSKSII